MIGYATLGTNDLFRDVVLATGHLTAIAAGVNVIRIGVVDGEEVELIARHSASPAA